MKNISRETVSKMLDPVRARIKSPAILAAGIGLAGAGLGIGLWENIIETGGSLGRYPIRKMTGMSNEEYNQAVEGLATDDRYRWLIPTAIGSILGGGYLASKYNANQVGKGQHNWAPKTASLHKKADELWSYGGYVPEIDFSQIVNTNSMKKMFTNDPILQKDPYVMNTGIAILNDASNKAGYTNPTLGNIYDSTASKMKKKLSWAGVTDVMANTMLANAEAHLLTGVIGAVAPLSEDAKQTIIDDTTWATAIINILK